MRMFDSPWRLYAHTLLVAPLALGLGLGLAGSVEAQNVRAPAHNNQSRQAEQRLAMAMLQSGDAAASLYREALAAALQSISAQPDNANGWMLAGQAYIGLVDYAGADTMLVRAQSLFPGFAEEIAEHREVAWGEAFNRGAELYESGRMEDAIPHFQDADRIYQEHPDQRVVLGYLYAQVGRVEDAIAAFRGAQQIFARGMPPGADDERRAQWLDGRTTAFLEAGRLLAALGRYGEAVEVYRGFLAIEPDNLEAQTQLVGVLTEMGQSAEAASLLGALRARTDLDEDQQFTLGIGYFQNEQFELAAEAFQQVVRSNTESRDASYNLAQSLWMSAVELQRRADAAPEAERGPLVVRLGQLFEQLRDAAERASRLDPYGRDPMVLLIRAYHGLGQHAADAGAAQDWANRTQAALDRHAGLPFEVFDVQVSAQANGYVVDGKIENLQTEPGERVRLRFSLVGSGGAALSSGVAEVNTPARGEVATFRLNLTGRGQPSGWKYERVEN